VTAPSSPPSSGRHRAMRVVAAVMAVAAIGFGLFTAVFGVIGPDQEQHAFHNVVVATLLLVLSAPPALGAARAPAGAGSLIVLAALAVAGIATMALSLTLDPFTLPFVVLIVVLWLLRPTPPTLVPPARSSIPMLVLVLVAAGPLLVYAAGQADLQRTDQTSDHAAFFHWVETSFFTTAIVLLGLLAGLRPAAYRLAAWMSGFALAVLGAGSLLLAGYASAPDAPWGWAALAGGVAFIGVAEWEASRAGQAVQKSSA
jgi:hypothetical protein